MLLVVMTTVDRVDDLVVDNVVEDGVEVVLV